MPEPILLLRLEGNMQSWGIRARWDIRDTMLEPTKSAVIGMIGCAMGRSRDDPYLEELDKYLLFGVRVDRKGIVSTDYHTVCGDHPTADMKVKMDNTIVSKRDYLHDAAFLVALAVKPEYKGEQPHLLRQIKEHLENPKWPIYLGRKSCVPSRPVLDGLVENEYESIKDALERAPWSWYPPKCRRYQEPPRLVAWVETPDGPYERQDAWRLNPLRIYGFRRCELFLVNTEKLEKMI